MAGAKERILDVTAEHFRRQGYYGTGIKQILAAANAPFGSLYHHFPGGKEELGTTVIRESGRMYFELFRTIAAQAPDPAAATEDFFTGAAETLRETGYADACPIETVALEVASTNEPLREACHEVFEMWLAGSTEFYARAGIDRAEARELALTMLCLLEGAFVLCRAGRTTEALEVAGRRAAAAVRAAL
jgi:AcrR family transcriptional regulator